MSVAGAEAEVMLSDARWEAALGDAEAFARRALNLALGEAEVPCEGLSASFLFTDDAEIAALNARFRLKDAATNVLSWPAWDLRAEASGAPPGARPALPPLRAQGDALDALDAADVEPESLGDVALAWETVEREAVERGLAPSDHALHLAVHGVLHLLGYDHEREGDAALMEGLESRAMLAAGLADPYLR